MTIPQHVLDELNITDGVDASALSNALIASGVLRDNLGLAEDELVLLAAEFGNEKYKATIETPLFPPLDWQYVEVVSGGSIVAACVSIPREIKTLPTTAAGRLLAHAWFQIPSLIKEDHLLTGLQIIISDPRSSSAEFAIKLAKRWSATCPFHEASAKQPQWIADSGFELNANSQVALASNAKSRYQELFLEAISEVKPQWRFLSLYRIVEHGYLTNVFSELSKSFFAAPQQTVQHAMKQLDSELSQLKLLVEAGSLTWYFEQYALNCESLIRDGNQFAIAIKRSAVENGQLKDAKEPWVQGVVLFYKTRCAIVHAGTSSPIFEAYPDGSLFLEDILNLVELTALAFLGIELT